MAKTINGFTYLYNAAVECRCGGGIGGMDAYLHKTNGTAVRTGKLKS